MAGRYTFNPKKKLSDGREVYISKKLPKIPKTDSDIYVAVKTGDRLDSLASQFYSNSSDWWIIATANNIHDASLSVDDGTILRIPIDYNTIVNNFNK